MPNTVKFYDRLDGKVNWRVDAEREEDGKKWNVLIAHGRDSGYDTKGEAQRDFFGLFFGDYDESFLAAYNEWDPQGNKVAM